MDKIKVISTSTVKIPPQTQPTALINLTPWDLELLFLEYSQKGLLFLKPSPNTGPTPLIHHLKLSLQRTLHLFPPLAGRLATTASDGGAATSFSIDCDHADGGALFVHANADAITAADVIRPKSSHSVRSFFPLTGVRNNRGGSQPLLAVQVTELADACFVGFSINHMLADGTSFWRFVSAYAAISRGQFGHFASQPPLLDRSSEIICLSDAHNLFDETPVPEKPSFLGDKVFYFTKENVAKLKARANHEMAAVSCGTSSSHQAIIAHVWRSIIRCRFTSNNSKETTTFEIPIGARQRWDPPIPEEYFGNAVFPGLVTLEFGHMMKNSLGWAAWQINRMVASFDGADKVKEYYVDWIEKPNFLQCDGLPSNYFVLINSPRFDVYGNDFGWGRPVAVRSGAANSCDGRITISSGSENGSVEIEACLFDETLDGLVEDEEFMEFVTL